MAKLAKLAVAFEHPSRHGNRCGQCSHFTPPDECKIIAGMVQRGDWCKRFSSRAGARENVAGAHLNGIGARTDRY